MGGRQQPRDGGVHSVVPGVRGSAAVRIDRLDHFVLTVHDLPATVGNLFVYMGLWLVPVILLNFGLKR